MHFCCVFFPFLTWFSSVDRVGQDVQARIRTLCNLIPGGGRERERREEKGQFSAERYHLIIGFSVDRFQPKTLLFRSFIPPFSDFYPFFRTPKNSAAYKCTEVFFSFFFTECNLKKLSVVSKKHKVKHVWYFMFCSAIRWDMVARVVGENSRCVFFWFS